MRFVLAALACLLFASARPSEAVNVVVNNGLAPPHPDNVFETASGDNVFVRNVGCVGTEAHTCVSPGAPTAIAVRDGARLGVVDVHESSTIHVSGGEIRNRIIAYGTSSVRIEGGTFSAPNIPSAFIIFRDESRLDFDGALVFGNVTLTDNAEGVIRGGMIGDPNPSSGSGTGTAVARGTSRLVFAGGQARTVAANENGVATITGGTITRQLVAQGAGTVRLWGGDLSGALFSGFIPLDLESRIEIAGTNFEVDGVPVGPGLLAAPSGTLRGLLLSGDFLEVDFCHRGCIGGAPEIPVPLLGSIVIVPEPSTGSLVALGILGIGTRRRTTARS